MSDTPTWDPPLHLFEHDYCGFYAAETLEEAMALLHKDMGAEISKDDLNLFEAWDDDQALTIYDEDGGFELVPTRDGRGMQHRLLDSETKTAGEWARTAKHKGYQFGGEQ